MARAGRDPRLTRTIGLHPAMQTLMRPSLANDQERLYPLILEESDVVAPPRKKITPSARLIVATLQLAARDYWVLPPRTAQWWTAHAWLFEGAGDPPFTLQVACEILEVEVAYIRTLALEHRAYRPGMRTYSSTIAV